MAAATPPAPAEAKPRSLIRAAGMRVARALIADRQRHAIERPGAPYTLGMAAACIAAQLEIEFPKPKPRLNSSGRDELFDAIVTGCDGDLESLTRQFAKVVGIAKRDILEATPDCTVEEIKRRVAAYKKKYSGAVCTPMALANHWPEFGQPTDRKTRGFDYTQEPPKWRERLRKNGLPGWQRASVELLCDKPWDDIRATYGREIWTALGTT